MEDISMPSIQMDLDMVCSVCQSDLVVRQGYLGTMEVEPCQSCLDDAEEEGREAAAKEEE